MLPIQRWRGGAQGRSRAVAYQGLVWTVATSDDESGDVQAQARRCLVLLDQSLAEAGTDKTRLVSAQIFLADMNTKAQFDAV
jgi:enamine deaminase RidA (YjgF/YER057c/UK114 family)